MELIGLSSAGSVAAPPGLGRVDPSNYRPQQKFPDVWKHEGNPNPAQTLRSSQSSFMQLASNGPQRPFSVLRGSTAFLQSCVLWEPLS